MKNAIAKLRGLLFIYKCKLLNKNISIKPGLMIFKKLTIDGEGCVNIGYNFQTLGIKGDNCQYVTIDTHSKEAVITIGNNVKLYSSRISSKFSITIGNNILIEDTGILDTDFHSIDKDRGEPIGESSGRCQIMIGNNVSIGAGSLVTKGVTIGDNVVVIPGSVVSTSIKPDSLVGGNPARPLKSQ